MITISRMIAASLALSAALVTLSTAQAGELDQLAGVYRLLDNGGEFCPREIQVRVSPSEVVISPDYLGYYDRERFANINRGEFVEKGGHGEGGTSSKTTINTTYARGVLTRAEVTRESLFGIPAGFETGRGIHQVRLANPNELQIRREWTTHSKPVQVYCRYARVR